MKGQKLYVRIASPADNEALSDFYRCESSTFSPVGDSQALVGKVIGEIVAHLSCHTNGSDLVIDSLLVASALRRKRIGRAMVEHLAREIGNSGASRLVIRNGVLPRPFLMAIGFREEADRFLLAL